GRTTGSLPASRPTLRETWVLTRGGAMNIKSGFSVVVVSFALGGCAVTSQMHSELAYGGVPDTVLVLDGDGIGVLTPAAPTGQESDKQALGDSLSTALAGELDGTRVIGLPAMLSAINRAGLAGDYAKALVDYENTGILDRDTLRAIGDASGVRY